MNINTRDNILSFIDCIAMLAAIATLAEGKYIAALVCAAFGLGIFIWECRN